MSRMWKLSCVACLAWLAGCGGTTSEVNPYLTLAEALGVGGTAASDQQGTASGQRQVVPFRQRMSVTFRNNHLSADLNVSFLAWVNVGSIRSAEQQDELLSNGYVQLGHEVRLGTAFVLPVGTMVYEGSGTAGATPVFIGAAVTSEGGTTGGTVTVTPTTEIFNIITPDVILAFSDPPVSCDSVAFVYTRNGQPLEAIPAGSPLAPFEGSTRGGGFKTLAQIDVYQCNPLKPGLFFRSAGGLRASNEFIDGDSVTVDFNENPDANGAFANVTISTP